MSEFGRRIRPYIKREILAAHQAEARGKPDIAFSHLERAHILGQPSTVEHVRVHWHMFLWGFRQRNVRECLGQLLRIVGARHRYCCRSGAKGKYRRHKRQLIRAHAGSD